MRVPLGIAFLLRSDRAERGAGLFVVGAILFSALVVGFESVHRLIEPRAPGQLGALAAASAVGAVRSVRPASKTMADRGDEHPSSPMLKPASEICDVDLPGSPVIPVALEPDIEPAGEAAARQSVKGVSGDE